MSYALHDTAPVNSHRPGVQGMGYFTGGRISLGRATGFSQGVRLGDMGTTSFSIGPDGQYSFSTASQPTAQSIGDQITQWASQATIVPGAPNGLVVGLGIVFVLLLGKGRHR